MVGAMGSHSCDGEFSGRGSPLLWWGVIEKCARAPSNRVPCTEGAVLSVLMCNLLILYSSINTVSLSNASSVRESVFNLFSNSFFAHANPFSICMHKRPDQLSLFYVCTKARIKCRFSMHAQTPGSSLASLCMPESAIASGNSFDVYNKLDTSQLPQISN
jgi:hypothetical protein